MRELRCIACGTPLSNGTDTFGYPGAELCWTYFVGTDIQPCEIWCPWCDMGELYTLGYIDGETGLPDERNAFCLRCGHVYEAEELAAESWRTGYLISSYEELASVKRLISAADDLEVEEAEIASLIDSGEIPADGIIEVRGMPFCWACGMLAQPGDENFDWCSHITGRSCPYYHETEDDEDEFEGEAESGGEET